MEVYGRSISRRLVTLDVLYCMSNHCRTIGVCKTIGGREEVVDKEGRACGLCVFTHWDTHFREWHIHTHTHDAMTLPRVLLAERQKCVWVGLSRQPF